MESRGQELAMNESPLPARFSGASHRFWTRHQFFSGALIPIVLTVFLAPFIGLLFYSSLNVDDFSYATLSSCPGTAAVSNCVRLTSVLSRAWVEHKDGSGRLLAPFLESLVMSKSNLSFSYGWLLLLVMLTNLAALSYFFMTALGLPRPRALLASGVFYAAWLACVDSPGENVFWLTAAMEYQLPISSVLVFAGLLSKRGHTIFGYLALALLAIGIPAQHEIAGVFLLACLLAGVIAVRVLNLQAATWWLCAGLVVLSLGLTMFSPGMADKMTRGHSTGGFVANFLPHAKRAMGLGVTWITNPVVLLAAFSIPLLVRPPNNSCADATAYQPRPRWLALAALGAMCVLLGEFASAETASSSIYGQLPARAVGWFQFLFWLLLVCAILIGVPEISQIRFSPGSQIGIFVLFAVSLLASGNFISAERDLRGPAQGWWRSSVARLKQRGSMVQFEPLPKRPKLFRNTSISMESGCWVNESVAFYLGATTVVTTDPGEEPDLAGCSKP
jgi:hypothetical protein